MAFVQLAEFGLTYADFAAVPTWRCHGYLIFQFLTPLILAIKGPAIAGQFGMTLAQTNGLLMITTPWLSSQAPLFGKLIATRSYDQLDRAFVRSLRSSFLLVLNHVVFAMAIYLRAHRREPLMVMSVIGAITTPLVVAFVGRRGGVGAIATSYLALTALGLVINTAIFFSRARAWHVRPV